MKMPVNCCLCLERDTEMSVQGLSSKRKSGKFLRQYKNIVCLINLIRENI